MRIGTAITSAGDRPVVETPEGFATLSGEATVQDRILLGESGAWTPGEPLAAPHTHFGPPLRPGKIVAVGLNYLDHIRESGSPSPTAPLLFAKFPSSVIGDGDTIVVDGSTSQRVDWEVELAVVIGCRARMVPVEHALDHVFGYSVANDVSARDVQFADGQWTRGKNYDTFCPLGPLITTAQDVPDPQQLKLVTRVNGETVQSSNTSEMIFSVAEIIAYCSRFFTLEPADVILTGTPWGCGEFMTPQRSLHPGDVVEVEIEKIGTLRNPVADAPATQVEPSR